MQAGILNVKLKYLKEFTNERKEIAARYNNNLKDLREINIPYVSPEAEHVYHLYVIKTSKREELVKFLLKNEIQSGIHYPIPPHLQKAYS